MKKNILSIAALSILCMGFASCSDDELPYSEAQVTNTELRTILEKQGIQFDETGHMLLDDKVQNLTKLDLTGTKFTDFQALTILPSLNELDLSDNEFGPTFDFSVLPTQITGVDLTGNDIYDFEGLVDAKMENDELKTTIKHKLVKLHLSESAKWNVEDLMPFYMQNKAEGSTVDMQMEEKGALKPYTTLREIPDAVFCAYLKTVVGEDLFEGNKLNIAKPMDMTKEGATIQFSQWDEGFDKLSTFEGVEYFINNPYIKPFVVNLVGKEGFKFGYLMPRQNLKTYAAILIQTTQSEIDFSLATNLANLVIDGDNNIESLDLSNTKICNQAINEFEAFSRSTINVKNCSSLKEIILPKATGDKAISASIELMHLPELAAFDFSNTIGHSWLAFVDLPKCKMTYPTELKYRVDENWKKLNPISADNKVTFIISKDVKEQESTTAFTGKFKDVLHDFWVKYRREPNGSVRWK